MKHHLDPLRRAADTLESQFPPSWRLGLLWFLMHSGLTIIQGRRTSTLQQLHNNEPRAVLLACVAVIITFPWFLAWITTILSFAQYPAHCRWMIGGALIGLIFAAGVTSISHEFHADISGHVIHIGNGLGYAASRTPIASWLDATLSEEEGTIARPRQYFAERSPINPRPTKSEKDDSPLHPTTSQLSIGDQPTSTLSCGFTMLWIAANTCQMIAPDAISGFSKLEQDKFELTVTVSNVLCLVVTLSCYAFTAYGFLRSFRARGWECGCGLALGGGEWSLLRLSGGEDSWQFWVVDGSLAFVGGNIGLLVGFYLRYLFGEKAEERGDVKEGERC